jgi:predicted PurR-regulated permease PerM
MKTEYFLGFLFIVIVYWMGVLYEPYLLTLFIAALLAIATSTINLQIAKSINSRFFGAVISTVFMALLFFLPIGYFISTIAIAIQDFDLNNIDKIILVIKSWINNLPDFLAFLKPYMKEFLQSSDLNAIATNTLALTANIGKKSAVFLKDAILIVIFYFFVVYYKDQISLFLEKLIPLSTQDTSIFKQEITDIMGVVFYSIIVTAVFEGALFGIIAHFYGYDGLLLGIMYGFASLIPIVGGILMWLPVAIYTYVIGDHTGAIVIAVYSIVVISFIADTIIKPIIIKYVDMLFVKEHHGINELIIFFAILAGLSTFGFWGTIIGPAITAFFFSLINLYERIKLN